MHIYDKTETWNMNIQNMNQTNQLTWDCFIVNE